MPDPHRLTFAGSQKRYATHIFGSILQAVRANAYVVGIGHFKRNKLVNGSQFGQVGPIDPCGQVGDLDPSLVKFTQPLTGWTGHTCRLIWSGQKY